MPVVQVPWLIRVSADVRLSYRYSGVVTVCKHMYPLIRLLASTVLLISLKTLSYQDQYH